jgi:outer membrane protein assembly factor BamB
MRPRSAARLFAGAALLLFAGAAGAEDWPQWGRTNERNLVSDARGLPDSFDPGPAAPDSPKGRPKKGEPAAADPVSAGGPRNLKWSARLGTETYGNPTIAGGRVFVGTNNGAPRDPKYDGDRAVVMCFRESDGEFLWQLVMPKVPRYKNFNGDHPGLGICSSPTVDGDRVYVTTSRSEVLCLDAKGLADGNGGPFTDEAALFSRPRVHRVTEAPNLGGPVVEITPGDPVKLGPADADVLWRYDMMAELKVWPQDATNCSILVWGDYVYVNTSNGVDLSHKRVPSPDAPSFIVLEKRTGKLVAADDAAIGPKIFHGQWSNPSMGLVQGRPLVFFGGGDGVLYAFDARPEPGKDGKPGVFRKVWWFDCNPPEYRFDEQGKPKPYNRKGKDGRGAGPSEILGTPVFHKGRVYVAIGQDSRHGKGQGCLSSVDAAKTGDVTETGRLWQAKQVDRSFSTPAIADGLVYCPDYSGILHCFDADTGAAVWTHDLKSPIWGSALVADGKVYLGTENRRLWVLAAGRDKRVLAEINLGSPSYTTPVVANGVLYVTSQRWLYAVQAPSAATAAGAQ